MIGTTARAGNNDTVPMGDQAAVAAGAVVAAGDDCGSVAYNPAGLAGVDRDRISISASLFEVRVFEIPGFLRTQTPNGLVETPAAHTAFDTVPPAVVVARSLRSDLVLALSLTVPSSESVDTNRNANASDGSTFTLRENARNISTSALYRSGVTLAWAPLSRLRVGATLNFGLMRSSSLFAFELSALEASGRRTFVSLVSGQQATAGGLGGILGVQWAISRRIAAGLALEPPLVGVFGSIRSENATFFSRTVAGQEPMVSENQSSTTDGAAGDAIGRFVSRLGVAYVADWGWLSAQVDYRPTAPSVANVRAGAIYQWSPTLRIGAGAFTDFDTSPPSAALRFDFVGGTSGVLWRKPLPLQGAKRPLVLATTLALRYAYGWGQAAAISANPTTDDIDQFVTVTGSSGTIHEISLYIGSGVDY